MLSLLMHVANLIYADDWQYPSARLGLTIHCQVSTPPAGARWHRHSVTSLASEKVIGAAPRKARRPC